jgi:hypothetical protein
VFGIFRRSKLLTAEYFRPTHQLVLDGALLSAKANLPWKEGHSKTLDELESKAHAAMNNSQNDKTRVASFFQAELVKYASRKCLAYRAG